MPTAAIGGTHVKQTVSAVGGWLYRRAENILAALLAVILAAFIVQVASRYLFRSPIGWTSEITLVAWLWLVLWGAAFVVTEKEEIRFDLVYAAMGARMRLAMSFITGAFIIVMYVISYPATLDYVLFMKVQTTAYLHIRFDLLYVIYPVFTAAVIARYAWLLWNAWRGRAPEAFDPTKASSGV